MLKMQDFVNNLVHGVQGVESGAQNIANNVAQGRQQLASGAYNVMPDWMQVSPGGQLVKTAANQQTTQNKPISSQTQAMQKMQNSLPYMIAMGISGDMANPGEGLRLPEAVRADRKPPKLTTNSVNPPSPNGSILPNGRVQVKNSLPPIENTPPTTQPGAYPYSSTPNSFQKLGQGQNQATRQIALPPKVGGAQAEAAVHDTLDRLGFNGSADQQYTQLQPKMNQVHDWIGNNSSLATNPQNVPISHVKSVLTNSVNQQFPIGSSMANNTVTQYTKDLYNNAAQTSRNVVPSVIDTPTLYKMKLLANHAASDAFKKLDNGTTLNPMDKVAIAGRNAWDSVISEFHPDVKQATTDMSNLFNAADSLGKARFNPPAPKDVVGAIIPENLRKLVLPPILGQGLNKLANNPTALKVGAGLLGGAGLIAGTHYLDQPNNGLPNIPDTIANALGYTNTNPQYGGNGINNGKPGQDQTNHGQNITYLDPNFKPNPDGTWNLDKKMTPGGNYMTRAQFDQATSGMSPNNPQYGALWQKYQDSQNNASAQMGRNSGGIFNFMKRADLGMTGTNIMLNGINTLPTGFQNAWKPGLDVRKYLDNSNNPTNIQNAMSDIQLQNDKFSELYNNINQKAPGDDLLIKPGDSQKQMYIKLNQQANFIKSNYKNYEDPYLAASTPTGTSNTNANQSTIQTELAPKRESGDASGMIQGGTIPSLTLPSITTPIGQ